MAATGRKQTATVEESKTREGSPELVLVSEVDPALGLQSLCKCTTGLLHRWPQDRASGSENMPVVAILNRKGGKDKTTLATNLAWVLAEKADVLLLDADPQATAHNWVAGEGQVPKHWSSKKPATAT